MDNGIHVGEALFTRNADNTVEIQTRGRGPVTLSQQDAADLVEMLLPQTHEIDRNAPEPAEGSVVLINGETGTAYQRLFSDGLWWPASNSKHRRGRTWDVVTRKNGSDPVILLHNAPESP